MSEINHRSAIVEQLAERITSCSPSHPLRVAIDGIDAAGKTSLADELIIPIETLERSVIRASIDGFHNARAIRYQRGLDSPEGYYLDSFNLDAFISELLIPLGPGGNCNFRREVFNHLEDIPVLSPLETAHQDSILLCDGVFMLRPELANTWDFSIFVHVDFEVGLARGVARDLSTEADQTMIQSLMNRYTSRYIPAQKHYLRVYKPLVNATVAVDNNDLNAPKLIEKSSCIFY